jgi:hypothetical protein
VTRQTRPSPSGLAAVVIAAAGYLTVNPVDGHTTPHAATARPPGKKHI